VEQHTEVFVGLDVAKARHAAALAALPVRAETTRFCGPTGRELGRAETSSSGTTLYRDSRGHEQGRAEPDGGGGRRFLDAHGREVGRSR